MYNLTQIELSENTPFETKWNRTGMVEMIAVLDWEWNFERENE